MNHLSVSGRRRLLIIRLLTNIIVISLLLYGLLFHVFGLLIVKDDSLSPSVEPGDLIVYYRLEKEFHVSDLVVYEETVDSCIATGNDHVRIHEGEVFVNDVFLPGVSVYAMDQSVELKDTELFLLNHSTASDSFCLPAETEEIQGAVIAIVRICR